MTKNHALTRLWHSRAIRQARHLASPRLWYRYLTAQQRPLPTFIVAGAMKAGTTSLFSYLAGHPLCLRPLTKEVNFFDQNYSRGERWYRMHFPVGETNAQCSRSAHASASSFEASPHYMFEPQVAGRVRQSAPEMKAIFLLRNPVSRAYSHYQHEVRRGVVAMPFEQCIDIEIQQEKDDDRSSSAGTHHHRRSGQHLSYLARGVYIDQLLNWRAHFRAEQMLVLEAERMFNNPGEVFKEVLDFLGLDLWTPPTFGNVYPGRYHTPISPAARDRAMGYFASHNERLFHFLGQRHEWC